MSRGVRLGLVFLLLPLASACGDDVSPTDAGAGDAGVATVDIPWLAEGAPPLTPSEERACPDGFRALRSDTGVLVCLPWPEGGPAACSGPEAHFPGEPGCARVGSACPAGDFAEDLPVGASVVYVKPRPGLTGAGTIDNPYNSLALALSRAAAGSIIAIAKGTYDEFVEPPRDMTLWGACPEETILTSTTGSESEAVVGGFFGGSYALRNATIRTPGTIAVYLEAGSQFRFEDVIIDQAAGFGIYATGLDTHVDLQSVIVRNVTRLPSRNGGVGVQILEGATGAIRRVAISDTDDTCLIVAQGSSATCERLVGRDAHGGGPEPHSGSGMSVQEDSTATLRESAFEGNEGGGLFVQRESTVDAADVGFAHFGTRGTVAGAPAIEARRGSTVTVRGVHVDGALQAALQVGEDGVLDIADAIVVDMVASTEGKLNGLGATVEGTGTLRLERALFERLFRAGLVAFDGTTLVAIDVTVRDIEPSGPRNLGSGITVVGGATLERVVVERATGGALAVIGPVASLDAHDVVIRETRTDPETGFYGRGIEVNLGARAALDRVLVSDNHETSVMVIDPRTTVSMSNALIRRTRGEECAPACAAAYGYGVSVILGATLDLSRFGVVDTSLVAIQVADGATLRGMRGEVRVAPIGVNVQAASFDLSSGFSEVEIHDVDRNFDSDMLPIPQSGLER